MTPPQLLIDVGNGRTKFGLTREDRIVDHRDLLTAQIAPDGLRTALDGWSYDQVVISSVVPTATGVLRSYFGAGALVIGSDIDLGIGIRYPQPETIGQDRLANAVALAKMYGAPGVVIDFGTAVTFDILDADACYVGGVIAPGLRLMTDYLHERTALLPLVELHYPPSVVGKSTVHAIQVGAAIGYQGMVRGLLEAIRTELGQTQGGDFQIVATGGDAAWIATGLPEIQFVDDDLTLHGLRLIGNRHVR